MELKKFQEAVLTKQFKSLAFYSFIGGIFWLFCQVALIGAGIWALVYYNNLPIDVFSSKFDFKIFDNFEKRIAIWLAIRIPFVILFWVTFAMINKKREECDKKHIYFSHLYHLLSGMLNIKTQDENIKEEYVRAGMSYLASSPLEALKQGKSHSKALNELLAKFNFNVNQNYTKNN